MICTDCGRSLVPAKSRTVPEGYVRHFGRGMCAACWQRARRAGLFEPVRPGFDVEQARTSLHTWQSSRRTHA